MTTRDRLVAALTQMHGRAPTEAEIASAERGYHDAKRDVSQLARTLPPDRYRAALDAEITHLIDEIHRGPRKPS